MPRKSKKDKLIEKIKSVIKEWGSFSVGEVQADQSPCVNSLGSLVALAERFNNDNVDVVVYDEDGNEHDSYSMTYEELSYETLCEIEWLVDDYDADQYKTWKRCQN